MDRSLKYQPRTKIAQTKQKKKVKMDVVFHTTYERTSMLISNQKKN